MGSIFYTKRLRVRLQQRTRIKFNRPKSFKTEEAAKKWAEANKIKNYTLRNLKSTDSKTKKIIVES